MKVIHTIPVLDNLTGTIKFQQVPEPVYQSVKDHLTELRKTLDPKQGLRITKTQDELLIEQYDKN